MQSHALKAFRLMACTVIAILFFTALFPKTCRQFLKAAKGWYLTKKWRKRASHSNRRVSTVRSSRSLVSRSSMGFCIVSPALFGWRIGRGFFSFSVCQYRWRSWKYDNTQVSRRIAWVRTCSHQTGTINEYNSEITVL